MNVCTCHKLTVVDGKLNAKCSMILNKNKTGLGGGVEMGGCGQKEQRKHLTTVEN